MNVTHRYWAVVAFGFSVVALAVLFDRPVLFLGTVGVAFWLLYQQLDFVHELSQISNEMIVSHSISRQHVPTNAPLTVILDVSYPQASSVDLRIESRPPVAARGTTEDERTVHLGEDDETASTEYTITFPTAGTASFESPVVTVNDEFGLFTARYTRGDTPTVNVEQRESASIQVGTGGQRTKISYGEEQAKRSNNGLTSVEIREYTPGDSLRRIDWNATARLSSPHVREFENESNTRLALFVDHRPSVATGRQGETQFAYLREAALALVSEAHERSDAIALFGVGSNGVTVSRPFRSSQEQYATVRDVLHSLSPEARRGYDRHEYPTAMKPVSDRNAIHDAGRRLQGDGSKFAVRVRPFVDDATDASGETNQPLFDAVRTQLVRNATDVQVALFTSDEYRNEVRNCVQYASWRARYTDAFLAPEVLFEPRGLSELEVAYKRYVSFERFRRTLASYPKTAAYEVVPGDRVDTILSTAKRVQT